MSYVAPRNAQKTAQKDPQEALFTVLIIEAKSIVLFTISLAKSITKSAIGFKESFEHIFSQPRAKLIGPKRFGMEFWDFVPNLNRYQKAKSIWLENGLPNRLRFLKPI